MTRHVRPCLAVLAVAAALALPAGTADAASSSPESSRILAFFGSHGGQLPPCAFTQAELEAALAGTPKQILSTLPDFKREALAAIAAHKRGDCKGVKPTGDSQTSGIGGAGAPPETTTTPTPTTPTTPATVPPAATAPNTVTTPTQPATTVPTTTAPVSPAQPAASSGGSDRTSLAIAAIAIGALLLALLGLWGLARTRGWDSQRLARARHAWGEAGFRTTGVWAEFADWLRLGR